MEQSRSISEVKGCYGCGLCATVCPIKIIQIQISDSGFYEPYIADGKQCVHCGLCRSVCSYLHDTISVKQEVSASYAAWSKDSLIRKKSSSGGVWYELASYCISKGYKVCAVRYNATKKRAEHYIASMLYEMDASLGSKYIQSYTVDAFKAINRNEKYIVSGTPCQIDSFRRYIRSVNREDNFILVDFFCHGVPSIKLWEKYMRWAEYRIGGINSVSWRNKNDGWHDSWAMKMDGQKGSLYSRYSKDDPFYNIFLSDSCLGKACYDKCKYKYRNSAADIRIGDLWGAKYSKNEEGVSAVAVFTKKGISLLNACSCVLIEEPFDIIAEAQMKKAAERTKIFSPIQIMLNDESVKIEKINSVVQKDRRKRKMIHYINRLRQPINLFKCIIKRLDK